MNRTIANNRDEPLFLVRVEHEDESFIRSFKEEADGIVIGAKFDAPHWEGSASAREGKTGSELKEVALQSRTPFILDPETWRLVYLDNLDDDELSRTANTEVAQALTYPASAESIQAELEDLTDATLRSQTGAMMKLAAYFQFASRFDPWLDLNIRAIKMAQSKAGGTGVAAAIFVPIETLRSGALLESVPLYAQALEPGATVILTVCDLSADQDQDTLARYFETVGAFARAGLRVILDRASEVCVPAMTFGAAGAIRGVRMYRTASATPRWNSPYNVTFKLKYFVASRCELLPRDVVRKRRLSGRPGSLEPCRRAECSAHEESASGTEVRIHNTHAIKDELRFASEIGSEGLQREFRQLGLKRLVTWADAMAQAEELRKAS